MMYKYYNDYPILSNGYLYKSQEQLKSVIKQFDTAMIKSGLVRAPDTGQLNVNNIPDLDLVTLLNVEKTSNNIRYRIDGTYASHLPLLYCFSDTLQSTKPVYIRICFEVGRMNMYQAPPSGKQTYEYPCGLFVTTHVGNQTDGKSNISSPLDFYAPYVMSSNINDPSRLQWVNTNYGMKDSIINYQKEKGLLHINLCPSFSFVNSNSPQEMLTMRATNTPLLSIIVYRVNDDTIGAFGVFDTLGLGNSSQNPNNRSFKFKNGANNYNDSNMYSLSGFYNTQSSYINGKIITSPVTAYDPLKRIMVRNPLLLLSSSADSGNISGSNFDVIISETEKYNYYVYSGIDNGFNMIDSTRMNLLIYSGDAKHD